MTPIKTPIQVTQHLLEKKESKPLGKKNKTGRRSPSRTLRASPSPVKGPFPSASCVLCGHRCQWLLASRGGGESKTISSPVCTGVATSPATSKTAHLKAACCMHSSPTQPVFDLHSPCPSPLFLEPDTKCQERYLSWYVQVKGNSKPSRC